MTLLNEPATQFAAPSRWVSLAHELAPTFAARAAAHDTEESFVADNYIDLKDHGILAAGVPANLGGGGASFAELCALLRVLGLDLERLLRDVQAAQFHPMQHKRQLLLSGRVALGLDPVG